MTARNSSPILHQVVLELKYRDRWVYFDKCGSLMDELHEALGVAFLASPPESKHADLHSPAERLVVRYGVSTVSITQSWLHRPVRVQELCTVVWKIVAEGLKVDRHLTRCGARFWFMWPMSSPEEAEARLIAADLVLETPGWSNIFGGPAAVRSFTGRIQLDEGIHRRVAVKAGRIQVDRSILTEDLDALIPEHSIMLDLDFVREQSDEFKMGPGQLSDYFRKSWREALRLADATDGALATSILESEAP